MPIRRALQRSLRLWIDELSRDGGAAGTGIRLDRKPCVNKERMIYEPLEGRTKFTIVYDINVGGFMKLFSAMIVCSMRRETKKSLGNLRKVFEAAPWAPVESPIARN
jgi:hypothetical protein